MTSVAIFGFAFLDGFLPLFAFSLKNSKNRCSYIRTTLSSYPRRHVSSNGLKNSFKTMAYATRKMNWRSGSRVFVDEIRKRFRQLDTGNADTTRMSSETSSDRCSDTLKATTRTDVPLGFLTPNLMGIGGLRVHVRTVPIMRHSSLKNSASASRQAGVFFVSSKPIVAYKIGPNPLSSDLDSPRA